MSATRRCTVVFQMCRRAYLIQYFGQKFDARVCNHTCDACGLKLPTPLVPVGTGIKLKPAPAVAQKSKGPRGPPVVAGIRRGAALAAKGAIVPSVYNVPPAPRPVLLQPTRPLGSTTPRHAVPAPGVVRAVPPPTPLPAVMGGRVLPASFQTPRPSSVPPTQQLHRPAPRTEPVRKRPPPDPSLAEAEFQPFLAKTPQPPPSRPSTASVTPQPRAIPALVMEPVKPQNPKGIQAYFQSGLAPATAPPRKRQKPLDFGEEERF
jgi:hypothetical protein